MKNLLLKIHRELNQDDFKIIWKEAFFIFDSNVLLDLYRLPESAKNDLISVLQNKDFNVRIWIAFQVLTEFLNNRLNIVSEQKNMFNKVISLTENHIEKLVSLNNEYDDEIKKLNLNQRHSTISPDEFINKKKLKKTSKVFKNFIENLNDKEKQHNDVNDVDEIKNLIIEIFENKIGEPLKKEKIAEIVKEGEERYNEKIPPGYMDSKKEGSYIVGDLKFPRKFGDLLLWKEIIKYINDNKLQNVILVTGDVKEDWWEEKRGRKIGPRRELLSEIYTKCETLNVFHMYNTSTFLKYAKQEINSEIKDSSIEDTKKLISLNKYKESKQREKFEIYKNIDSVSKNIEDLKKQIELCEQEIRRTSIYRRNLFADGGFEDDTREYAHNLNHVENKLQEELDFSKKKLVSLYKLKSFEMARLEMLNNNLE